MENFDQFRKEGASKGNSEDSLLVIYIFQVLKKYSSSDKPLTSQDVMDHLREDYSIGISDKSEAQRKKVRRHLDTLHECYWKSCIQKKEGKTRNAHKWYYDASRDKISYEEGTVRETLSKEEIDFIIDMITASKIINSESTTGIVEKLLKRGKHSDKERDARLRKIENEGWTKSINRDLVLMKEDIRSCIEEFRKIRFDYESQGAILATPYGWTSDDSGKYILIAKPDGEVKGEFRSFFLDKMQNLQKAELDSRGFDNTYFDRPLRRPDVLSMENLFSNIKIITTAIEKKTGIAFEYLSYVVNGEEVVVAEKAKRVLPHQLVFNDGKYYLIGYDEEQATIGYYRVDLISKLLLSDTKIKISDWNTRLLSDLQREKEVEKHPLMLAGRENWVTFKVAESALDRVIDAFAVKPDKFVVTKETRAVKDPSGDDFHDERLVKVQVRTTLEEAFRWALANADAVEIDTQAVRDRIARIAEPIYSLYTQSLPDKVRENLDRVLKKGRFELSVNVDADTAYATYEELRKQGKVEVVNRISVVGDDICEIGEYMGDFINTRNLSIWSAQCEDLSWVSKLANVEVLEVAQVPVEDASWMKDMKELTRVFLAESSFSDLSALSNHKKINHLDISDTNVRDLRFVEKYEDLAYLNIVACPIKDYSPLLTMRSRLTCLEIDKKALEQIGEDNLRQRHLGITIIPHSNSPFWRFLV